MNLKFLDLKSQNQSIQEKIILSIKKNINNSSFIGGKDLIAFQKEFADFLKIKFCLGVANGTDALEIAIKALNLKKGSEVIVPANTWISTAEAVLSNHLKIKFVDIDETHNICIKDLSKKINKNTSAVIIVHLFTSNLKLGYSLLLYIILILWPFLFYNYFNTNILILIFINLLVYSLIVIKFKKINKKIS